MSGKVEQAAAQECAPGARRLNKIQIENRRRLMCAAAPIGPAMPTTRRALSAIADGAIEWPVQMEIALGIEGLHQDCLATLLAWAVVLTSGRTDPTTVGNLVASICYLVRTNHGVEL